jgi:CBS domain-containing protein
MVRNPLWSRTVQAWRRTIDGWLLEAGEASLRDAAILYDAAPAAGRADLLEEVRGHLIAGAVATPAFCARFARAIDLFEAPGGFLSGLFADRAEIDLKKRLIFPIVHGVRALALERGVVETGTVDRLRRLQEASLLDEELVRTLTGSFHFVTGLRLTARLEQMRLHQPLDNVVRPGEIGKLERDLLKETHGAVRRLREVVRHHFRLAVLG